MIKTTTELAEFHAFVGECLRGEWSKLSPEEVVELWRLKHPSEEEAAAVREAVREAIADMEAGERGLPLEEFDRQFRKEHNLPPRP